MSDVEYLQENQPDGVPPLPLTGERTLPDVPEENYWYRRHLVVYEWIAARVAGKRVVDMACGEGYGVDLLAERGGERGRRRRQPRGPRARAAALRAAQPALRARPGRELLRALRRGRLPADDRARRGPRRDPRALQVDAGAGGLSSSRPRTCSRWRRRGRRSPTTPGTSSEYREAEFRELCEATSTRVELLGLFHARKLRAHEIAIKLGWDSVHKRARPDQAVLRPLHPGDRRLRLPPPGPRASSGRWTSSPSAMPMTRRVA